MVLYRRSWKGCHFFAQRVQALIDDVIQLSCIARSEQISAEAAGIGQKLARIRPGGERDGKGRAHAHDRQLNNAPLS